MGARSYVHGHGCDMVYYAQMVTVNEGVSGCVFGWTKCSSACSQRAATVAIYMHTKTLAKDLLYAPVPSRPYRSGQKTVDKTHFGVGQILSKQNIFHVQQHDIHNSVTNIFRSSWLIARKYYWHTWTSFTRNVDKFNLWLRGIAYSE